MRVIDGRFTGLCGRNWNLSDLQAMIEPNAPAFPGHACQIISAQDIFVAQGVNAGDILNGRDDVCLGDIYQLNSTHQPLRLVVTRPDGRVPQITAGSDVGIEGENLHLEAQYTLMATDGDQVKLLILCLDDGERFVLPLSPMATKTEYTLLSVEPAPANVGLADMLCVSFARGTMISLASGEQRAIENLVAGDRALTRDHGAQEVRWIGQTTLRAVGVFAPVVITAGTLGNSGNLIVSQHHRMFLYQRQRPAGVLTSELLVQAKHLVDNERVYVREGGFVDYFSLVFDRHEIIYAEGVPAESLMVNETTVNRLPAALSEDVRARFPGLTQQQHFGTEAGRQFLDRVGPAALYKPRGTGAAR